MRIRTVDRDAFRRRLPCCSAGVRRLALVVGLALLAGCASAKQMQFFEVVHEDPDTGETQTNYYRMTIRGGSYTLWSPATYKLKAAYLNVATVDVLEGKGPFIPEADLPLTADQDFKDVMKTFRTAVKERAAAAANTASSVSLGDSNYDAALVEAARQAWFASLSNGDIVSIGQTRSANPYEFRKLVFYATAKNLDLQKTIGPQIDSMISKVQTLARREQQRAEARQTRQRSLQGFARQLLKDNPTALGLVNTFFAAAAEPSTSGSSESQDASAVSGTDDGG